MYATYDTSASYYQKAYSDNGYGGMAYYTSPTCGYPTAGDSTYVETGCTTDYAQSEIKSVVDAWAADKFKVSDLKEDATGYSARLISHDDLVNNLGYENRQDTTRPSTNGTTSDWVYNSNYSYWTMSSIGDFASYIWNVRSNGYLFDKATVYSYNYVVVRPVATIKKTVI